jgi:hypothetical protein
VSENKTNSRDAITAAVALSPTGANAKEIATATSLGYSTVTGQLAKLVADGILTTVPPSTDATTGRKTPATFFATAETIARHVPNGNLADATRAAVDADTVTRPEVAAPADEDDEKATDDTWEYAAPEGAPVDAEVVSDVPAPADPPAPLAAAIDGTANDDEISALLAEHNYTAPEPPAPKVTKSGAPRVPRGQLTAQIVAHFEANPGTPLAPGAIARALGGHSSGGAVDYACKNLVKAGTLTRTGDKPIEYTYDPEPVDSGHDPKKK